MKKYYHIAVHLLFWVCFFYFFIEGNWLRPFAAAHPYKEWIIGFFILVGSYLVYFWIVPRYYVNGFFLKCFCAFFFVWLAICMVELVLIHADVERLLEVLPAKYYFRHLMKRYLLVCVRNAAILSVFFLLRTNRYFMQEYTTTSRMVAQKNDIIPFPQSSNKKEDIYLNKIVYIQHQKNYTFFHMNDNIVLKRYISLLKTLEILPTDKFVRISRNTVINKEYIDEIISNKVVLTLKDKDGASVELSISPAYISRKL